MKLVMQMSLVVPKPLLKMVHRFLITLNVVYSMGIVGRKVTLFPYKTVFDVNEKVHFCQFLLQFNEKRK